MGRNLPAQRTEAALLEAEDLVIRDSQRENEPDPQRHMDYGGLCGGSQLTQDGAAAPDSAYQFQQGAVVWDDSEGEREKQKLLQKVENEMKRKAGETRADAPVADLTGEDGDPQDAAGDECERGRTTEGWAAADETRGTLLLSPSPSPLSSPPQSPVSAERIVAPCLAPSLAAEPAGGAAKRRRCKAEAKPASSTKRQRRCAGL
ncbi:MAG: hypothetical protein BJ554DRAFT_6607 [Olpidium bornovanus]|uniref:Uncharacterized protein n=1 Tax=Olpidium bornovanus TaxID=278681 RepID=A0A8H7ZXN6_9FUNG|nr:MAG: hypothetical protein BJ554DRAFT_6607 [Olpidium bornovanus]